MVAQHIHHTHFRYAHLEEVRALRHAGSHEQTAVAAAHDGEMLLVCILVADKPFAGRDKVVEHVLLAHLRTGKMPFLAILAATTQHHMDVYSTILQERHTHGRERRRIAHVEATITIHQHGILAVELHALLVGEEHRDAGSVLARAEHHLRGVVAQLEAHLRTAHHHTLVFIQVIPVYRCRHGIRGVAEEQLLALPLSAERGAAHSRKLYLADFLTIYIIEVRTGTVVLGIEKHHLVAIHKDHVFQHGIRLCHELLPVVISRLVDVGNHHAVFRRPGIRNHINPVSDNLRRSIVLAAVARHLNKLRTGHAQIPYVQV